MWTELAEYAVAILCIFLLLYFVGRGAAFRFVNKTKKVDPCAQCGKELFVCVNCGCVFDSKSEARKCADWDRILKHPNHNNHHHDED